MRRGFDVTRILKYVVGLVLVAGVVMQICMVAAISGKTKDTAQVQAQIKQLSAERDNCNVRLAGMLQRDDLELRAVELGMQWPTDDQIRIISIPEEYREASTHTAEIADVQ